jgi:hypothetical protein
MRSVSNEDCGSSAIPGSDRSVFTAKNKSSWLGRSRNFKSVGYFVFGDKPIMDIG